MVASTLSDHNMKSQIFGILCINFLDLIPMFFGMISADLVPKERNKKESMADN